MLEGVANHGRDFFDEPMPELRHGGRFSFRRESGGDDAFAPRHAAEQLAFASRCTASFPVAFEPVECLVGETRRGRPDMASVADFAGSRCLIDGGVLLNKPIKPALEAIFAQPATGAQVRRVLAYVVPDPGSLTAPDPTARDEHTILGVALSSLVTLPRAQTIAAEVTHIGEHNRTARAYRASRRALLESISFDDGELQERARALHSHYRDAQIARWHEQLSPIVDQHRIDDPSSRRLVRAIADERFALALSRDPTTFLAASVALPDVARRGGEVLLDVISAALRLVPSIDAQADAARARLIEAAQHVHAALALMRRSRAQAEAGIARALDAGSPTSSADEPLQQAIDAWLRMEAEVAGRVEQLLYDAVRSMGNGVELGMGHGIDPLDHAWLETAAPQQGPGDGQSVDLAQAINARHDPGRWVTRATRMLTRNIGVGPGDARSIMRRLAQLDVVVNSAGIGGEPLDQLVELVQVSARRTNELAPAFAEPEDKVTGLGLMNFAAFYKQTWRANDWMWGRLDGASHLARVLLDPVRLWIECRRDGQLDTTAWAKLGTDLAELAFGDEHSPEGQELLRLDPPGDHERRMLELERLRGLQHDVGRELPAWSAAVARRLQLRVLAEELGHLASSARADRDAGGDSRTLSTFLAEYDAAGGSSTGLRPRHLTPLLRTARFADERVEGEWGSDMFTAVATHAAVVPFTAAMGRRAGLPGPVRAASRVIRVVLLATYWMGRVAVRRSRTTHFLLLALVTTGGALMAVSLLAPDASSRLDAVAWTLLLGAAILAIVRRRILQLLVATTLAMLTFAYGVGTGTIEVADSGDIAKRVRDALAAASLPEVLVTAGFVVAAASLLVPVPRWILRMRRRPATRAGRLRRGRASVQQGLDGGIDVDAPGA